MFRIKHRQNNSKYRREDKRKRIQWGGLIWVESLEGKQEWEWAKAIFKDKLPEILSKVRNVIYLKSPRISSKINKKKYLLRLETKNKEEIWKAIKENKKTDYLPR